MDCGKAKMDSSVATGSLVLIALILPFSVLTFLDTNWCDLSVFCYGVLIALLSFSSSMLWTKLFLVISNVKSFVKSEKKIESIKVGENRSFPAATAIIAGDLHTEFENLIMTTEAFFNVIYPGNLEVIIAYSAENDSIQAEKELQLKCLVNRMPNRFTLHCVENLTSQEKLVNTAAQLASGEFITIFFAGHYPTQNCILEAYKWREMQNASKSVQVEAEKSTFELSKLEAYESQDLFSTLASKVEIVSTVANEFLSFIWSSSSESFSSIMCRSDLSLSHKSFLIYEYIWRRVFPWMALQILPVVAFLCYKHCELRNLSSIEINQIAANLMMSSY